MHGNKDGKDVFAFCTYFSKNSISAFTTNYHPIKNNLTGVGKWRHAKIVADPSTSKYDVFINGVKVASDVFRNPIDSFTGLQISSSTNPPVSFAIDNIEVYTGTKTTAFVSSAAPTKDEAVKAKMQNSVLLFVGKNFAYSAGNRVNLDTSNADVKPVIIGGRTLLPARFVAESVGGKVGWDPATKTVTITKDSITIKLIIGSPTMTVNGTNSVLEVPAQVINGRTLVPLRALVEALGKKVYWNTSGVIGISDSSKLIDDSSESDVLSGVISKFN